MLRECREHGYFRGDDCPICGEEGKFLASDEELNNLGRLMAGVLRHFPERFGLEMDDHGWIDMREFTQAVQLRRRDFHWLRPHHIHAVIETDPKGRYQFKNGAIRATYGHSFEVDLELPSDNIPDMLFYPTTEEEVDILLETGIRPSDRKKVHLSRTFDDAEIAGKHRVETPIVLSVDAKKAIKDGVIIQKAGKTVFITDVIPSKYIKKTES
ncbi:MAG: RNA 2'-phosphotransferase [Methanomassiliicoccales archaeon]|nr:MAG: RNA 2'-phosphotransferase [Methanomassiliicoccales archaeon]